MPLLVLVLGFLLQEVLLDLLDPGLALLARALGLGPAPLGAAELGLGLGGGVGADGLVARLVHGLQAVGLHARVDEAGELPPVRLVIVALQRRHVVGHVLAEDVVAVHG